MSAPLLAAPPALRPGDAISVVAPASAPKRAAFDAAMANLQAAGYRPKTYRDVCTPHGYLSGTDAARADELNQAFADPETTMVLAARGGYGVGRILDRIDYGLLAARPKIVCGYSDITALHAAIGRLCGLVSFHGPNLIDGLGDDSADSEAERSATHALLAGQRKRGDDLLPAAPAMRTVVGGQAEGRLVGGNAAVLLSILGTPYGPDFEGPGSDGAILLLEDVHEAPYRIDRLLTQLRLAGVLGRLGGVVLGYFTDADARRGPSVDEVAAELLEPLGVPTLASAPIGHEHPNLPLPLGARVELDVDAGTLRLRQEVVTV